MSFIFEILLSRNLLQPFFIATQMEFEDLLKWIFRLLAIVLSWQCNTAEFLLLRLLYLLVAGYLGYVYIFYYLFVHGVLGISCITPVWL